jgi:hypothetical protein
MARYTLDLGCTGDVGDVKKNRLYICEGMVLYSNTSLHFLEHIYLISLYCVLFV